MSELVDVAHQVDSSAGEVRRERALKLGLGRLDRANGGLIFRVCTLDHEHQLRLSRLQLVGAGAHLLGGVKHLAQRGDLPCEVLVLAAQQEQVACVLIVDRLNGLRDRREARLHLGGVELLLGGQR